MAVLLIIRVVIAQARSKVTNLPDAVYLVEFYQVGHRIPINKIDRIGSIKHEGHEKRKTLDRIDRILFQEWV